MSASASKQFASFTYNENFLHVYVYIQDSSSSRATAEHFLLVAITAPNLF